jgi:hypothetical protein
MNITEEIKIKSLSEYVETISRWESDDSYILYRGQNKDVELLPKIFRNIILEGDGLIEIEKKMLKEFKIKGRAFLNFEPQNDFEWLAIAQHHGLKTRLLDWTENPLAALWFCIENKIELNNDDGVVWVFKPLDMDWHFFNELEIKNVDPFNINSTKIYRPPYISKRIIAQSGVFTIHNFILKDNKAIPLEKEDYYKNSFTKIRIIHEFFNTIRKNLINCGIHSATLFPDLDGLSKLLNDIPTNPERMQKILDFARCIKIHKRIKT